jgi:Flp pilus assembly protein TadB
MLSDLLRTTIHQTARLSEQLAPFGVLFWGTAALLAGVSAPVYGLASLVAAGLAILLVAYFVALALAAQRVRIATQPPTARPPADLRDEVAL